MKAELINKNGKIISIYKLNKKMINGNCVDGIISNVYSWDNETGEPIDEHFFADAYIKWDGCSHFRFYGEDYVQTEDNKENNEIDSYYHICGIDSYMEFMRTMIFGYEVMIHHVGNDFGEVKEYEKIKVLNLLKGYVIKYYDENEQTFVHEDKF